MNTTHKPGLLVLVHPETGDTIIARRGEGDLAYAAVLDGYEPIGPNGKAAAAKVRAVAAGASA